MNPTTKHLSNTINSESQTRLLQSRIETLEKHLLEIHNSLATYVTKTAKTRDEADLLAANVLSFAQSEQINCSLRNGLINFGNDLNSIQDFRDNEVKTLEERVINRLSIFGETTRKAKEELKSISSAKSKQLSDLKDGKLRELVRTTSFNEVSNIFTVYEMQIQSFEMKKIREIKKTFLEFIKTELLFHAKTIEVLTEAYKHVLSVDEDQDINDFINYFGFSQSSSPKREDLTKTSEEDKIETISTLRRFNSAPNFNSSIDSKNSESFGINNDSKAIKSVEEQLESDSESDSHENDKKSH